jgi:hypothetical protein
MLGQRGRKGNAVFWPACAPASLPPPQPEWTSTATACLIYTISRRYRRLRNLPAARSVHSYGFLDDRLGESDLAESLRI